jgi:hypothetical protein
LLAKNRGTYDKNSSPKKKAFKKLIKQHSSNYEVGIHPSFESTFSRKRLASEVAHLQDVINKDVQISRQHYLQLKFPDTYLGLVGLGIENDYSLGYGTSNGFRASYSMPFFWYNIHEEKQTNLLLHPFCYMDANSIFEQKLTTQQALKEMLYYYNAVKQIDGDFCFIMHNHFLANQVEWSCWADMYEDFLKQIND